MYRVNDIVEYHSVVSDEVFIGRITRVKAAFGGSLIIAYTIVRSTGESETIPAINVIRKVG